MPKVPSKQNQNIATTASIDNKLIMLSDNSQVDTDDHRMKDGLRFF